MSTRAVQWLLQGGLICIMPLLSYSPSQTSLNSRMTAKSSFRSFLSLCRFSGLMFSLLIYTLLSQFKKAVLNVILNRLESDPVIPLIFLNWMMMFPYSSRSLIK